MISLEHFYYGQLVHHGKATNDVRVLARSAGVTDAQVALAVRNAAIPPHPNVGDASWAIVRGGGEAPFIVAQAQLGSAGQTTLHYIFLTSEVYRSFQGNLNVLLPFIKPQLPVYDRLGDTLVPLSLPLSASIDTSEQVDILLDLLTYTKNKPRDILQPLLSAVVKGVPIAVVNAPAELAARTRFVQGLMTLLPGSTRFGVTFATHLNATSKVGVQIAFREGRLPEGTVIYDWEAGTVSGNIVVEDYGRFMISQLRLDVELAIQQSDALTPVAGWRYRNGDSLASALAYASKRSKYDHALRNNMPVQVDEVSRILAEDITLSDELQVMYARHLLTMSLALENITHVDPVASVAAEQPSFAQQVRTQLDDAVEKQQGGSLIFEMLERWMQQTPQLATATWSGTMQQAALVALDEWVTRREITAINRFLDQLQTLPTDLQMERIVPRVIERVLPIANADRALPNRLLLLAMRYLQPTAFRRLLSLNAFTQYLEQPMKQYLARLASSANNENATLLAAARSVDEAERNQALLRLVQVTLDVEKADLIDATTLDAVAQIATTAEAQAQKPLLLRLAHSKADALRDAGDDEATRFVLQLLLASGNYAALAHEMTQQSRYLYGGERQFDYVRSVYRAYANTPISPQQVLQSLEVLNKNEVRDTPLLAAGCGALVASEWSPQLEKLAARFLTRLEDNPRYLHVLHPELVLALLQYYLKNDPQQALRAVRLLPTTAAKKEARIGLAAINDMYKLMRDDETLRTAAFAAIRQYVREAEDKPAGRIIEYFGKELGAEQARPLRMAYVFSRMMGNTDLATYGSSVSVTATLLSESVQYYMAKASKPTLFDLSNVVAAIRSGVDVAERVEMAEELRNMAKALVLLGDDQQKNGRAARYNESIVRGTETPRSALELFRAAGGVLSRGMQHTAQIEPSTNGEIFKGTRPADLRLNVVIAADVLRSATGALLGGEAAQWTQADIRDELESLRDNAPEDETRDALRRLAVDWQVVADLVVQIARDGNADAVEDNSRLGRRIEARNHQPKSVLEMYRFIYGTLLNSE